MPTHKRSASQLEHPSALSKKSAKLPTSPNTEQLLALANLEIHDLKNHVARLYDYINTCGFTLGAPPSIQKSLDFHAAKTLAAQISNQMSEAYDKWYGFTIDADDTMITSDDLSIAMMPFFSKIDRLRAIPRSTTLAYNLARTLANNSYGELEGAGAGGGRRPSDMDVDDLLKELAIQRREENPDWNFVRDLDELEQEARHLANYGIDDFWVDSIYLLRAWRDESEPAITDVVAGAEAYSSWRHPNAVRGYTSVKSRRRGGR